MAVSQEKLRELIFQILMSYDVARSSENELVDRLVKEHGVSKEAVIEAHEEVKRIALILPELDEMISAAAKIHNSDRVQTLDRNILRLGIYELFFDKATPLNVVISESTRLAHQFGTPSSAIFVTTILDTLYKASKGQPVDVPSASTEKLLDARYKNDPNAKKP